MQLNKITTLAVAFALAVPAFAQFSNGGNNSSSSSADLCKSYNRFGVSYTNTGLSANKEYGDFVEDDDHYALNGFALEYIHGFSISKKLPMFIETGLKANFGFGSKEGNTKEYPGFSVTEKILMQDIYLAVPVNYAYKFGIGDNMAITPYIGLNFKLHLMTRMKGKREIEGADPDDLGYDKDELEGDWINVFSDDDEKGMGDKDYTWNRFQLGWHIGVGFNYRAFYLGVNYGTDFIKAFKYKKEGINSGNLAVTVGVNF